MPHTRGRSLARSLAAVCRPPDFANPLAKQAARIWQVPFAIEIPLPLETSDLNPSGICAADCRLIRMVLPRFPPRGPARCRIPRAFFPPSLPRAFRSCYFATSSFLLSLLRLCFCLSLVGASRSVDAELLLDHFCRRTLPC